MEKIELRKVRDFGQLFNDVIAFIRVNFKSYFGTIIFLSGPFVLMTGLLLGYLQSIQDKVASVGVMPNYLSSSGVFAGNTLGTTFIFVLIFLLTTLVANAAACLYFSSYDKTPQTELPLKRNIISPFLAAASWRLFYNWLILFFVLGIILIAVVGIFAVLMIIPYLNIVIAIVAFLAYLVLIPIVGYIVNASNYLIIRDKILVTDAISKVLRYMRGNFWWTWLLLVCALVSLSALYLLFNSPYYIYSFIRTLTRVQDIANGGSAGGSTIIYVIFASLSMLGSLLVINPIFLTFCVFNFHSGEEKKEGKGLLNRIDELDTN